MPLLDGDQPQSRYGKFPGQHDHQRPRGKHAPLAEHTHGGDHQQLVSQGVKEFSKIRDLIVMPCNVAV